MRSCLRRCDQCRRDACADGRQDEPHDRQRDLRPGRDGTQLAVCVAIAIVLVIIVLALLAISLRQASGSARRSFGRSLTMYARHPLLRTFVGFAFVFLLAPIVVVVLVSFNPTSDFRIPSASFHCAGTRSSCDCALSRSSLPSQPAGCACSVNRCDLLGTLAAIGLTRSKLVARDTGRGLLHASAADPEHPAWRSDSIWSRYASAWGVLLDAHRWTHAARRPLRYTDRRGGVSSPSIPASKRRPSPRMHACAGLPQGCAADPRSSILSGAIFAFIVSFSDINLALFVAGPRRRPCRSTCFPRSSGRATRP